MGKVNQPTDVNSVLREHTRQIAELTKRVGLSSAVISRGGLTILNEGELVMVDENGTVIFKVGQVEFGEGTSYGLRVSYSNGNRAIVFGGAEDAQVFALCDEDGTYVVTNDSLSGQGLGRPFLNYRLVPAFDAVSAGGGNASLWPSTTSTSPVKIMYGINPVQHPRVSIGVSTVTAGGGNVAWRLDVGGQTAASGSGVGSQTVAIPGWADTIEFTEPVGFDLYAWCTGGATRAWIQCDRLYGLES